MKKRISLLITGIIISSVLAGCGGGSSSKMSEAMDLSSDYSYDSDDVYSTEMAAESYDAEMPASPDFSDDADSVGDDAVEKSSRKIIKTVNITAETEEFDDFINTVSAKVDQLGGYMESTDITGRSINSSKAQKRSAYLVARIPSGNLDKFVTTVTDNSNITNKSESAEDVTLSYADTEARIASLRTEQERLNELLRQADDLDTMIVLEQRLTEVRYEIESYESRLRTMDNMVDYSTVYLRVTEVERYTVVEEPEQTVGQRISQGFSENLMHAGEVLQDSFVWLIVSLPILFILVLFIAVPTIVIILIIRLIIGLAKGSEYRAMKKAKRAQKKAVKKARKSGAQVQPVYQEYVAVPGTEQAPVQQTYEQPVAEQPSVQQPVTEQPSAEALSQDMYSAQAQFMEQVNIATAEYDAVIPVNEYQASETPGDNQ